MITATEQSGLTREEPPPSAERRAEVSPPETEELPPYAAEARGELAELLSHCHKATDTFNPYAPNGRRLTRDQLVELDPSFGSRYDKFWGQGEGGQSQEIAVTVGDRLSEVRQERVADWLIRSLETVEPEQYQDVLAEADRLMRGYPILKSHVLRRVQGQLEQRANGHGLRLSYSPMGNICLLMEQIRRRAADQTKNS